MEQQCEGVPKPLSSLSTVVLAVWQGALAASTPLQVTSVSGLQFVASLFSLSLEDFRLEVCRMVPFFLQEVSTSRDSGLTTGGWERRRLLFWLGMLIPSLFAWPLWQYTTSASGMGVPDGGRLDFLVASMLAAPTLASHQLSLASTLRRSSSMLNDGTLLQAVSHSVTELSTGEM